MRSAVREQQHLQLSAVHRLLGILVSAFDATRFAEQKLAAVSKKAMAEGATAIRRQLVAQSELVELAHRVWQQVDADAERPSSRAARRP